MEHLLSQLQTSEHAAFCRSPLPFTAGISISVRASRKERLANRTLCHLDVSGRGGHGFGAISVSGSICCASAIENCGSLFLTAEQCKSDRTLKERRKRTGKLVRLFLFGEPDFLQEPNRHT
jgi:hypothetical protein